jgi:hypothetical protein
MKVWRVAMTKQRKAKIAAAAKQKKVRRQVMAHFRRSTAKNRKLHELLAKS